MTFALHNPLAFLIDDYLTDTAFISPSAYPELRALIPNFDDLRDMPTYLGEDEKPFYEESEYYNAHKILFDYVYAAFIAFIKSGQKFDDSNGCRDFQKILAISAHTTPSNSLHKNVLERIKEEKPKLMDDISKINSHINQNALRHYAICQNSALFNTSEETNARACRQINIAHIIKHFIWTAARKDAAFLAYLVAIPLHCLR